MAEEKKKCPPLFFVPTRFCAQHRHPPHPSHHSGLVLSCPVLFCSVLSCPVLFCSQLKMARFVGFTLATARTNPMPASRFLLSALSQHHLPSSITTPASSSSSSSVLSSSFLGVQKRFFKVSPSKPYKVHRYALREKLRRAGRPIPYTANEQKFLQQKENATLPPPPPTIIIQFTRKQLCATPRLPTSSPAYTSLSLSLRLLLLFGSLLFLSSSASYLNRTDKKNSTQ